MQLLCKTVQRLMSPDFPYSSLESWVSLLLLTSTLEKILQFFLAIAADEENIHTSTWSHRKEFMWRMREDLGQYVAFKGKSPGNNSISKPSLDQVFFKAAYQEMTRRGAIPHSADPIPILHGSTLALHCAYCDNQK